MTSAMTTVGILHPGAMGAAVAAACVADTIWCSDGRSAATANRAASADLTAVPTLDELVERSSVILSVCPPASAVDVADSVAALGFNGIYVDAHAIAPETARKIDDPFESFVDAGIIGLPPARAGMTRLYLSGTKADEAAALWDGSTLDARVIDGNAGAASALKLAFATWTKASAAMLVTVRAFAASEAVEGPLLAEWAISQPGTAERSEATAPGVAPKSLALRRRDGRNCGRDGRARPTDRVRNCRRGCLRAASRVQRPPERQHRRGRRPPSARDWGDVISRRPCHASPGDPEHRAPTIG